MADLEIELDPIQVRKLVNEANTNKSSTGRPPRPRGNSHNVQAPLQESTVNGRDT